MSKLFISCDDYIFRHDGSFYFKNQEWKAFYDRYLRVFENLRICNRVIDEEILKRERVLVSDPRIEIYPLPIFHGPAEYITVYGRIGKAMKSAIEGCDAAILRLPSTVAQRISRRVQKSCIPYACEVVFNARDGFISSSSFMEKLLWLIIDRRMRRVCKGADGVSCVTEHQLQKRYYSIKENHFTSHYSSLALEKSFYSLPRQFPSNKRLTIAHVSNQIRLDGRKGEKTVIDALKLLKDKGVMVNLAFAGDDWDNSTSAILEYSASIGVEGQVHCVGYLSRSELSVFLDESDLFVLPTKAEGLPRVIIEAMAKGLPVITTPVSGNPELIQPDYLVDYDDINGLVDRIGVLVTDKKEYEKTSSVNYFKSLEYQAHILEGRRDEFYSYLKSRCQ